MHPMDEYATAKTGEFPSEICEIIELCVCFAKIYEG